LNGSGAKVIGGAKLQGLIANHMMIATMATTMAAHTNGVTCFELPLRGESFAARSNSLTIQASLNAAGDHYFKSSLCRSSERSP
jgi:hypothetical protein